MAGCLLKQSIVLRMNLILKNNSNIDIEPQVEYNNEEKDFSPRVILNEYTGVFEKADSSSAETEQILVNEY